jgi:hypothetical protein
MAIDGAYDISVKSPMGDQKGVLTVKTDGATWTGSQTSMTGTIDITDGTIDGNTIRWTAKLTSPMPMTLDNEATIDGDTITGGVKAGAFGTFPLTGTRQA